MQADAPTWNQEETYRFLQRYYGKASITSAEGLSAQETVKQLYDIGRYVLNCAVPVWVDEASKHADASRTILNMQLVSIV